MQGRNVIIAILVVVLIALGLLFWKNNQTQTNVSNQTSTESKLPTAEIDTNSPSQEQPKGEAQFEETFANNNWLLESAVVAGQAVDFNVNVSKALTLNFEKETKEFSGYSGCNQFGGNYTASSPDNLSFGPIGATKMGCPETMKLESELFKGMSEIETFEIINGELVLTSSDGKTKLTYKAAI